jgi:protein-S-isoprenylcysteine O-methyltransferase Ste14
MMPRVPPPFTWIAPLFWIALAWSLLGELPFVRRERAAGTAVTDRGSKRLILVTGCVSTFAAFFVAYSRRDVAIGSFRFPIYLAGVACIGISGWLRRHCFRMLGESFTYDVRAAHGQVVVERGAYRYVRHPSYTAGMLLFGGIGLALCNWLSLAIAVVFPLLAYSYRIAIEERLLVHTLGREYLEYAKRTKRLIPFVI